LPGLKTARSPPENNNFAYEQAATEDIPITEQNDTKGVTKVLLYMKIAAINNFKVLIGLSLSAVTSD
jgi:hypothetical protein